MLPAKLTTSTLFTLAIIIIGAFAVSACSESSVDSPLERRMRGEPCAIPGSWPVPSNFHLMTAAEYETYLRGLPDSCDVSEATIAQLLESFPEEQIKARRWQERTVHQANLEAFDQHKIDLYADRLIDFQEVVFVCTAIPTWTAQMQDVLAYVSGYREKEPDFVARNASLFSGLEERAAENLKFLESLKSSCTEAVVPTAAPESTSTPMSTASLVPTPTATMEGHESTPRTSENQISTPIPTSTVDVPLSIRSGEVHRDHWYEASGRCDASEMDRWSDEVWQDTAVVYLGAAIGIGISRTDWSLSPEELQNYRDFLNGTRAFTANEWSSLFDAHKRFNDTLSTATRVLNSGALLIDDFSVPNFPHVWLATYHDVVPRLLNMSSSDGRLMGVIWIPQGPTDNPVKGSLSLFENQFYCSTAELQ